jgi:hypothetical protein
MAPPDAGKISDDDRTLIARLSVLDDPGDESTKVEEADAVLRAEATKQDEPIALSDQATAERERALSVSAADRVAAAEFEEPGDDDEVVSATPGIISIKDEDEDDNEPTASQRPPSARKTPTPVTGGARLQTPAPLAPHGAPRLPAPTPPPGKSLRLPTPSGGLSPLSIPLAPPLSVPQRVLTPALPIPAPVGTPATAASPASAIFNKVQLPMGGLVAFLVAAFGAGFIVGAALWGGQSAAPTVATQPAPAAKAAPPAPAIVVAPEPAPPAPAAKEENPAPTEAPAAAAEAKPAPAAAEAPPAPTEAPSAETPPPVRHVAATRQKAVLHRAPPPPAAAKPAALAAKPSAAKPAVAAEKPAAAKPAAAKPAAASKPAAKNDKPAGKAKPWVDPFAE